MSIIQRPNADGSSEFYSNTANKAVLRLDPDVGGFVDPSNYVQLSDHFLGDVISDQWSAAKGTDGQAVIATITSAVGGWLRLTSGDTTTVAESLSSLTQALNWSAEQGGLTLKVKIKPVSSVADVSYFIGFTDVLATTTLEDPMSLSGTTLTTNASNAVGFLFDTAATNDVWHCQGVKANTDTALTATSIAPTADTEQVLEIRVDSSGGAIFYIDGIQVASVGACVTASTALTPVVTVMARTTTSKSIDLDYVLVGSQA